MKLGNFLAIDPDDQRKGLPSFGKLDEVVFYEYFKQKEELYSIANLIRLTLEDKAINQKLIQLNDVDEEEIYAKEGKVLYRLHKI
ncbi:hypothetical protein [Telluribacter sp. SYSU D00476]|uniref:hypothetical protein n=1 Tax=Telluribacter sp. SYSU D00476 TaxID=2811430 RepID=UPI001FF18120|nr:hypothetical protein [Telluribacter sp. SYSU D00476]